MRTTDAEEPGPATGSGASRSPRPRPGRRVHVCALYSGPQERDRVLLPFLREGLRAGDECLCLVDGMDPAGTRRRAGGPAAAGGGRLHVHPASDVCSRPGELSVERATRLLATATTTATASSGRPDVPAVRAAAEMPWTRQPTVQDLLDHESAVGAVLAAVPAVFLCLHDLRRLGNETLVDLLRVHSTVLLEGSVLHHRHRPAPGARPRPALEAGARYPLATRPGPGPEGASRWLSLTGAELRVAELAASGMTNRVMASELSVSPHTVDAHLKHMYVKLGIHSRVELTVLALRSRGPST
ncbi:MEDS domain-containing protein [Nocardioides sp. CFH 31398]|uniref:MEDS domain-containing protein n=1 Tax=Nocardioides sp. CFH 31398 TaxID=2919579 RepID=UPI001F06B714|nr:MEDS domain-containing protein [Nocardioides sp. CFH 31398]MCH1867446.1 MEDS domain-containing protein [Nocardioides sp. CFH 31398]